MPTSLSSSGHSSVNYQPQETRSRLSKTLDQVLRDNVAIPHYMHFTELQSADHLARFWLEAESFRSTSWSRVRAHSLNSVKHSTLAEPVPSSEDGLELQEVIQNTANTLQWDGGRESPAVLPGRRGSSSSEAGLRPGTPRADTPSSQASSRTGTPLKVQTDSAMRDLSNKLMKSESVLTSHFLSYYGGKGYWFFLWLELRCLYLYVLNKSLDCLCESKVVMRVSKSFSIRY